MRRINDALGRFYSTLVYVCRTYVYLSVTLGKDRHIHTVTLGKDRHILIRIYACAHAMDTGIANGLRMRWRLKRLLWRDGEGWHKRECYRKYQVWLREKAFAAVCNH